jgi:hypothetical protein
VFGAGVPGSFSLAWQSMLFSMRFHAIMRADELGKCNPHFPYLQKRYMLMDY